MSVFLTASSPGLRTSPVKRGYWVVRKLLGERIPAPPPVVPELPKDEAKSGELSLPQLLGPPPRGQELCELSPAVRLDRAGLRGLRPDRRAARSRPRQSPGRGRATFPDGSEEKASRGCAGTSAEQREEEFVENLCRELLVYALGRGLILSDEPTIKAMRDRLVAEGHRFDSMIETIVTSPQFLKKRGRDDDRQ